MEAVIMVFVLLAITVLLTVDRSWFNLLTTARNEIVFHDRHQDYGAFILRRDYVQRLGIALLSAVLFAGFAVGVPKIIAAIGSGDDTVEQKKVVDVNLDLLEEEKKEEPPPPPPVEPPPPPKIETVQFTAIEAVDKPVEEPPPTQEDLTETTAATENQEGVKEPDAPPPAPVADETFDLAAVEEQPTFPGGMEKMYEFMKKNQKYPDMEFEAGIDGKVYVQFVVDKDGSIEEVKVIRAVSDGLDKEALRMVKAMPKWSPGKMNGKAVKCRFNLPVAFKLK